MRAMSTEPLARRDHRVPVAGSPDPASRAPVVVLATPYSGTERLRSLLDRVPGLACTSGTGILPLCEQALAVWGGADGRPGQAPSALAVSSTRSLADIIITTVLAQEGKWRWCETCTAMPPVAEAFLRLYPAARFVCLYRSCSDVIRAIVDASRWGIASPLLAPFISAHPGSTAAALTAYWAAHTEGLLAFERSHPQAVLRIRLEDLASAEQQTARAVTSFLGVTGLDVAPGLDGDAMLAHDGQSRPETGSRRPDTGHPPADLIPPAVRARTNGLLRQLDYPALPD